MPEITRQMLRDYLHDALPDAELVAVEKAVRKDATIRERLNQVRQEVDRGEHSIGAVWRRERLTCPTLSQFRLHLLQSLDDPELTAYIQFHLTLIGCPICQAIYDDLERLHTEPEVTTRARRKRIVDSSAGLLRDIAPSG